MEMRPSGSAMETKESQFKKAHLPMEVTPSGTTLGVTSLKACDRRLRLQMTKQSNAHASLQWTGRPEDTRERAVLKRPVPKLALFWGLA